MAPDARKIRIQQISHKVKKPVFVGATVRIGKGNNLPLGSVDSGIACRGKSKILLVADVAHARETPADLLCLIDRTIVHEQYFVIRVIQSLERFKAGLQRSVAIVARD